MRKLVLVCLFVSSAAAQEAPNYHAIDEVIERSNSYIAALEAQRNAALNEVVQLKAEIDRLKKSKCQK